MNDSEIPLRRALRNFEDRTPPCKQVSYPCDTCDSKGIIIENPVTCDCECHFGRKLVMDLWAEKQLATTFALDMLAAIDRKDGYCNWCRDTHSCTTCGGSGEV